MEIVWQEKVAKGSADVISEKKPETVNAPKSGCICCRILILKMMSRNGYLG